MSNLHYQVCFFSNWHCGSGQAAGADVDELVIKDRDGLPFIPGRTIKGLLSDACDELCQYADLSKDSKNDVFGFFDEKDKFKKGTTFFSDATLPDADRQTILDEHLEEGLYQSVSATAIDSEGIAKDMSLRKVQTVVPCTLVGMVQNVPADFVPAMKKAMSLVKRLGLGRNHGLGRCQMTIIKED